MKILIDNENNISQVEGTLFLDEYKHYSFCYLDELKKEHLSLLKQNRKNHIPNILDGSNIFSLIKEEKSKLKKIGLNYLYKEYLRNVDLLLFKSEEEKKEFDSLKLDIVTTTESLSPNLVKKVVDIYEIPKKEKLTKEIIRFLVVGVIATIVDYGIYSLFARIIFANSNVSSALETAVCTTLGFIGGLIVNYLLSIVWVYKDIDENATKKKSPKTMLTFTILSVMGLLIGVGIMIGFEAIGEYALNININQWAEIFSGYTYELLLTFIFFTLFFGIKTLIVMFWNYITRKIFIFKPKIKSRLPNFNSSQK